MRTRPILTVRCEVCDLRLTGEVHRDGTLYASRHPEKAVPSTRRFRCVGCVDGPPFTGPDDAGETPATVRS
jgi:hypothetical protein